MKDIYIIGVGFNTPVIIDLAELCGYNVKGLYHYKEGRTGEFLHGVPIIGTNETLLKSTNLKNTNFALSMGDNQIRIDLGKKIREKGGIIPTLTHPTASVSKYAIIEEGVVIQANSTIQANVEVKRDCVISFNVGISHNVVIEKGCYIAGQTIIGAYTHIKEKVLVGIGVVTISGKVPYIGTKSIIGAGSLVTKVVEDNWIVAGNPAKRINK